MITSVSDTVTVLAAGAAEAAGAVIGRLLGIALAIALIVGGVRVRRGGTGGRRVGGVVMIVLGALILLGTLAALTGGARPGP